jgi:hypothetical protein
VPRSNLQNLTHATYSRPAAAPVPRSKCARRTRFRPLGSGFHCTV